MRLKIKPLRQPVPLLLKSISNHQDVGDRKEKSYKPTDKKDNLHGNMEDQQDKHFVSDTDVIKVKPWDATIILAPQNSTSRANLAKRFVIPLSAHCPACHYHFQKPLWRIIV